MQVITLYTYVCKNCKSEVQINDQVDFCPKCGVTRRKMGEEAYWGEFAYLALNIKETISDLDIIEIEEVEEILEKNNTTFENMLGQLSDAIGNDQEDRGIKAAFEILDTIKETIQ